MIPEIRRLANAASNRGLSNTAKLLEQAMIVANKEIKITGNLQRLRNVTASIEGPVNDLNWLRNNIPKNHPNTAEIRGIVGDLIAEGLSVL